jgi:hypothetical protein
MISDNGDSAVISCVSGTFVEKRYRGPTLFLWYVVNTHWESLLSKWKASSVDIFSVHNLHYLCRNWGFHGGDYEEWRLLGTDVSEERVASIFKVEEITRARKPYTVANGLNYRKTWKITYTELHWHLKYKQFTCAIHQNIYWTRNVS